MAVQIQQVDAHYPQRKLILHTLRILEKGGVIVYPTDTTYGLGIDPLNKKAFEKLLRIKKSHKNKLFTFICNNIAEAAKWVHISNNYFRIIRRVTPGKYTFILPASSQVPKILLQKRDTVGIRIPDCPFVLGLVAEMGRPLLNTSVPCEEGWFYSDPAELAKKYPQDIDLILDAGVINNLPSTIVDFTGEEPVVLREGSGTIAALGF